jgi:drug/metabolite transporter (DMT)-like permease
VIPNASSYQAAVHLPAGVLSILLSLVPLFAFPWRSPRHGPVHAARLTGLFSGLGGVAALVAPEASLPDPAMVAFIPLALVAPLFYGIEGNVIARWGTAGLDPVQLLFGASVVGAFLACRWRSPPAASSTRARPGARRTYARSCCLADPCGGLCHLFLAGGPRRPVFAAQVAYLVTGFGVIWAKLLLGESYSAGLAPRSG